jgi:hypothetical protein
LQDIYLPILAFSLSVSQAFFLFALFTGAPVHNYGAYGLLMAKL